MAHITTDLALLRLLQLSSPALPVGAYAFSQGLEPAIDLKWLQQPADIDNWLRLQLHHGLACVDLPLLLRLHASLTNVDETATREWNMLLLASRETRELRKAETAAGDALARLLPELDVPVPAALSPHTFAGMFAQAAVQWQISAPAMALGYTWSWLENQVVAATKLLPLGQTRAQQLLSSVQAEIPAALAHAGALDDWELGSSLPGLALASVHHETQYTRLFRS